MRLAVSVLSVLALLTAACGMSPEQSAVRSDYNALVDAFEANDYAAVFGRLSSNTRTFLDDFAEALVFYGMPMGQDGEELLTTMMEGVDMSNLSREIKSIVITGDRAVVTTLTEDGDEVLEFVLEDGQWNLDFEQFMKDAIDEGLAGSGMTVDEILSREADMGSGTLNSGIDLTRGTGPCAVRLTNGLGSYDIYYVYISSSDETEWGEDWLGSSDILSPGNTLTAYVDPGTYDIMVEDVDGDTYSSYGVEVTSAGWSWTVTLADMD